MPLAALRKPPPEVMRLERVPRSGVTLIRATVVYLLALTAALAGAVTSFRCLGEDGSQLPTKATQEVSHELLSLFQQKNMSKNSPILVRIFKEESELEVWKQDTTGHFQLLKPYASQLPQLPPIPWVDNDGSLASKLFGTVF